MGIPYEDSKPLISIPGMLNLTRISGRVIEEPSQQPVGLIYLLADTNGITLSRPGTGEHCLLVSPNVEVSMTVTSDTYASDPVALRQVSRQGATLNVGSIPVVLKGIFRDGFEAP